jgi:hypothetical protein
LIEWFRLNCLVKDTKEILKLNNIIEKRNISGKDLLEVTKESIAYNWGIENDELMESILFSIDRLKEFKINNEIKLTPVNICKFVLLI